MTVSNIVRVAIDMPSYMGGVLPELLDYFCEEPIQIGQCVEVPLGRRSTVGVVCELASHSDLREDQIRKVSKVCYAFSALQPVWFDLIRFSANYYQRSLGETLAAALPAYLRNPAHWARLQELQTKIIEAQNKKAKQPLISEETLCALTEQQRFVIQKISETFFQKDKSRSPILLHGVTGSGKTEVYLRLLAEIFLHDADAQVLLMVPEINLIPPMEALLQKRFPTHRLITLHSGLTELTRAKHWLSAHEGQVQIILGTRLAILASAPHLRCIIVDEEHDAAYKQQEGLRYSAKDLAVWRAKQLDIPIILGSATPSLESWQHAQTAKYIKLQITTRAFTDAVLPKIQLIDLNAKKTSQGNFSETLIDAIRSRLERGEQTLLFLNRRGYAPTLVCPSCEWAADCQRCSAHRVLHKQEKLLRCHHCSLETPIPIACPECGNQDLMPMGQGTQRIEETLTQLFPEARSARIDADSTRRKGSAKLLFDQAHAGDIHILIGTQMLAKGHDFRSVTLVGVINADLSLFSHDFRAAERLFAQLMQVSGRAGRAGKIGEVLIQTRYPDHALYRALIKHDYEGFAHQQLRERAQAVLPPFSYQAILRAEARTLDKALKFLKQACELAEARDQRVMLYDPIPMTVVRVAGIERAKLLIESPSRQALRHFLQGWLKQMQEIYKSSSGVKWHLEVDPLDV